jgi:hypothetical protein
MSGEQGTDNLDDFDIEEIGRKSFDKDGSRIWIVRWIEDAC